MMNRCFQEVEDFQELVGKGDIKICFLYDNSKAPVGPDDITIREKKDKFLDTHGVDDFSELGMSEQDFLTSINGKYNYRSAEEANLPNNINTNLGITYPREIEDNEFWVCIDVDGQDSTYMVDPDPNLKVATRYYLFQCLDYGLKKRGIKALYVFTANQGYHIYFKATKTMGQSHNFDIFSYPNNILMEQNNPEIFHDFPVLKNIAGRSMNKKALEVFTKKMHTVAPGSVIDGKKYELHPSGVKRFQDVTVYEEKNVEELVRDILSEDCFFSRDYEKESQMKKSIDSDKKSTSIQVLSMDNIINIGDLIIKSFPYIPNMKHDATLALGGFLFHNGIDVESIEDLGNYIIDNAPQDLFRQSKEVERTSGFMKTLLHDAKEGDPNKQKTGLTTLKEMFKDTPVPIREFLNILWLNSCPEYHKFHPHGVNAQSFQEVKIDFKRKETSLSNFKNATDKDGNPIQIKLNSQIIRHVLTDINYIDDISSPGIELTENRPITFTTQSNVMNNVQYFFSDTEQLLKSYRNLPLAHAKGSSDILSLVLNEYENIGLINTKEGSMRPGIYFSRDFTKLKKFIEKDGKIEEVKPVLPDKNDLINALILLKQINDTYPWYDDKFATFSKLGMLLPYGYIFKTRYRSFIRGIILYGEAGTCKSSASELIVAMNVPMESLRQKESHYLVPGSEFSTVFRMGKALSSHSFPIAIEEVETIFEKSENRDLIKNAISRAFIRNPGGEGEYYSRAIPIFSANELSEEVEKSGMFRRFLALNFVEGERGDKEDVEEALSFLNENGIRNSRFSELYPIGQYIYYCLSENLDYFSKNPEQIINSVLKDMQDYSGIDLKWLIKPTFDTYYQNDRNSESQAELSILLETLKYHFDKSIKFNMGMGIGSNEILLETLIENNYSYLHRLKTPYSNGVLITSEFNSASKQIFSKVKRLSLNRICELLNDNLDLKTEAIVTVRTPSGFKKKIKGVFVSWEDFCSLFNIVAEKKEE